MIDITCEKYIDSMTKKFGLLEKATMKPERTPLDPQAKLTIEGQSPTKVAKMIQHCIVATQAVYYMLPKHAYDRTYTVTKLLRLLVKLLQVHLNAAQRWVCCLHGSKSFGITYTATTDTQQGVLSLEILWNDHQLGRLSEMAQPQHTK